MPTYDYRCTKCKHLFELFHSITDDAPKRCPKCKAKSVRIPSAGAGLLFKGSGFYITDYRSKSYKDKARQEGGAKTDAAKSEGGAKSDGGAKSEGGAKSDSGAARPAGAAEGSGKKKRKGGAEGGGSKGE